MLNIRALIYLLEMDPDDPRDYDWCHALLKRHRVDPIGDSCLRRVEEVDDEDDEGGDR